MASVAAKKVGGYGHRSQGLGGFGEGIAVQQSDSEGLFTPPPMMFTMPPDVAPKISIRGCNSLWVMHLIDFYSIHFTFLRQSK